jgi:putative transposase
MGKKKVGTLRPSVRKAFVDKDDETMSVRKQCELVSVARSGFYYESKPLRYDERREMEKVYETYIDHPARGARKILENLLRDGNDITRYRVQKHMRTLGIKATVPKPNLSAPRKEHKKYPYLLRGVKAKRANHIWSADITYIDMPVGRAYFVGIIDWYSRKLLSWRVSNTLDASFCVDCLNESLAHFGTPEVFNTDQGSQFTSNEFTNTLHKHNISISMDGKGRCLDNVFIERFFRTLKYEDIYLRGYETIPALKEGMKDFMAFYNAERLHQGLGYNTPDEMYYGLREMAA